MRQLLMILQFVFILWMMYVVISVESIEYSEEHLNLGDSWSMECYNPFKESASWLFISGLHFYNYYLYLRGEIFDRIKIRYNFTRSGNMHIDTLSISKTDIYHAGYYGCFPDPTTFNDRKHVKLILIEQSSMTLSYNQNRSAVLNMNISFVGHETPAPVFECYFYYGIKVMNETICQFSKSTISTCNLEKTFEPHHDIPTRCLISFKNKSYKVWKNETLMLQAKLQKQYIKVGKSWNASCDTRLDPPMRWLFLNAQTHSHEVSLHADWRINKEYEKRYKFNNSDDLKTFSIIVPNVDVYHAGLYRCTHKSSHHITEQNIELTVIEKSVIKLISLQDDEYSIIMAVCYLGHYTETPHFICNFNDQNIMMKGRQCIITDSNSTSCQLTQIFYSGENLPMKCQIWFGNYLENEYYLSHKKKSIMNSVYDVEHGNYLTPNNVVIISVISCINVLMIATIVALIFHVISMRKKLNKMLINNQNEEKTDSRIKSDQVVSKCFYGLTRRSNRTKTRTVKLKDPIRPYHSYL